MKEFYANILGTNTLDFYFGWLFFALLGFIIHKYILFNHRTVRKPFRLKFFLLDNLFDIIIGFILIYILGRFQTELLSLLGIDSLNDTSNNLRALLVGFFYTTIIQLLRKTKLGDFIKSSKYSDGAKRN